MSPHPIEDLYELAPIQEGMLYHSLRSPAAGVYVEQRSLVLEGDLDVEVFEAAWGHVVERHPVLRTAFQWEELDKPLQVVYRRVDPEWERRDWRGLDRETQRRRWERLLAERRERGFALDRAPLLALSLARTGDREWRFGFAFHHALIDGWSLPLVLDEVMAAYTALAAGRRPSLPQPRPYRDFILWLQRRDPAHDERFWRRRLAGFTRPTPLPGARPRSAVTAKAPEGAGEDRPAAPLEIVERTVALSREATAGLARFARERGLTQSTVLQGAWALLLARLSGEDDVAFGVTVSGRPADLAGHASMVGVFINTLPLRAQVSPEDRLGGWLDRIQRRQAEARDHEHAPLGSVQAWSDVPAGRSLFETILVFENLQNASGAPADTRTASAAGAGGGLAVRDVSGTSRTNYPLTLVVVPGERLRLIAACDGARVDPDAVERHLGQLETLLEAFAAPAAAERRLGDLPLLDGAERAMVLDVWGGRKERERRVEGSLDSRFRTLAGARPEAVAVVDGRRRVSYGELAARAEGLARRLVAAGVGPGEPVALVAERSAELVAAILGILEAGAFYVPLDPRHPAERHALVLGDSGARVLVGDRSSLERLDTGDLHVLELEDDDGTPAAAPALPAPDPDRLAYVIYTSGSTGRPKGVPVSHRSVLRLLAAARPLVAAGPDDAWTFFHSFAFDFSVWEIWGALTTGGRVVVVPYWTARSPEELHRLLVEEGVTVLNQTPSAFGQLVRIDETVGAAWDDLRLVIFGGEALEPPALAPWIARHGADRPRLVNMYGITETTVHVTHRTLSARDLEPATGHRSPIGRPLPHLATRLLDRRMEPVPAGVWGEIHVGGAGLTRGYLGRPALTAERFVPDPFAGRPGERLYKSGDLGRWMADGPAGPELVYGGRIDHQVQVRGFRVELGEVESALVAAPGVAEAVVVPWTPPPGAAGEADGPVLVAYVVAAPGHAAGTAWGEELRRHLGRRLPEPMIPARVVALDALPLTVNGKVDRAALPAPHAGADGDAAPAEPGGPVEQAVAELWQSVLGGARPGAHDDFFAAGGHSLLATRLVSRLGATFDVRLPLAVLFDQPTVAGLARAVEAAWRQGSGVEDLPLEPGLAAEVAPVPLSFPQERLWFLDRLEPGRAWYNIPLALRLTGPLDLPALGCALAGLVERHGVLRTRFPDRGGEPFQEVLSPSHPRWASLVAVPVVDLSGLGPGPGDDETARLAAAVVARPFDLAAGPAARWLVVRRADTSRDAAAGAEHVLVAALHHILADAWSVGLLVRDLSALYGAAPLDPVTVTYADFAVWERRRAADGVFDRLLEAAAKRLEGVPQATSLPTDRPRSAVRRGRGARVPVAFDPRTSAGLAALCRDQGATLFMGLVATFAATLAKVAGQDDLLLGTPVAGRNREALEGLLGLLVNTLVLRADLGDDPSPRQLLDRVRGDSLAAFQQQDLPFERLVDRLDPERSGGRTPLFQVMLVLQNAPAGRLELGEAALAPYPVGRPTARFEMLASLGELGDRLGGGLEYDAELFDRTTVARLVDAWERAIVAAVEEPDVPLSRLSWLSPAQRAQVTREWSSFGGGGGGGSDPCEPVHRTIVERAARHPEAVAVVGGDTELTYGQLVGRAGALARELGRRGAGPGARVGLSAERSAESLVGLLGILLAGAAVVPVEPAGAAERTAGQLDDSGVRLLVAPGTAPEPPPGVTVVPVPAADVHAVPPAVEMSARCLAYVIYTSGSTGRPKGVEVEHRQLAAYLAGVGARLAVPDGASWATVTPLTADLGHTMVFPALVSGGTLHVVPEDEVGDAEVLARRFARRPVDCLKIVPSHLAALVAGEGAREVLPRRLLVLGGEPLPPALAQRLATLAPGLAVVNHYGPTETTVGVAAGPVTGTEVTLGRPLAGARVTVTDRTLRPAPVGAVGQLVVGGPQVARGYGARPAATAERFVPDPFGPEPGGRLYLTGDLGRFLADGRLGIVGRLDDQVKIRGFRVEPGELAAVLGEHPGVEEAAVVVRRSGDGAELVACYVPRAGDEPEPGELAAHLARRLPSAVRPSWLVALGSLPRTANGKLDRRALEARVDREAQRGGAPASAAAGPAPRGWLEELIAGVWEEVLGTAPAGVEQSFFELGGHSLLATRVISRLRAALGVEIPLAALFEEPTVAGLGRRARELRAGGAGAPSPSPQALPMMPVPRPEAAFGPAGTAELPLSFGQRRLWFLDRLEGTGAAYVIPIGLGLAGSLDAAALAAALTRVVARHEVLRTSFPPGSDAAADGEPALRIERPGPFPLPVVDLSALGADAGRAADGFRQRAVARPFDLARGPLVRGLLVRFGAQDHHLLLGLHHVVSDGWSRSVMTRELGAFYRQATGGETADLPPLPIQYADYAAWQRRRLEGDGLEREIEHWRARLAEVPRLLPLPTDRPRTTAPGHRGDTRTAVLPPTTTEALVALARGAGATLFMALVAAFSTVLARRAGVDLLALGTPVAGRHRLETEHLIGFFLNTLVLAADLTGEPSFRRLLGRVRETALDAHDHQELPFERLVEELETGRDLSRSPLFQAMLVLQNAGDGAVLDLPGLEVRQIPLATGAVRLDLTLVAIEKDGRLQLGLDYRSDLFDATHAERLLAELGVLVAGAIEDPDRPVWALPLLAAGEGHQVRVGWNDRPQPASGTPARPWAERFAAAVARHRDAPAVRGADGATWSYGELARRSARWARHLVQLWAARGVAAEGQLVGIAMDRRPEALAAILAVLESGAAYLPLDPGYPPARLAAILDDARPSVVWTHRRFEDALPAADGRWTTLRLDGPVPVDAAEPERAGPDGAPASALAYVLYTSGSTGTPKGVAVSRGALDHYLDWVSAAYPLAPGERVLVHTPLGFDLTITGLLGPLLGGGVVEMVESSAASAASAASETAALDDDPQRPPRGGGAELLEILAARLVDGTGRIAFVKLTPSHLEGLDALVPTDAALDLGALVVGGEPVRGEQLAPWRRRAPGLEIFNEYGPTEATVGCVVHRLPAGPPAPGPTAIGHPLAGTRVLVVDRRLRPVPAGVLGELLVAGPGLARGYLGRPAATAERFVPDASPGAVPGGRVYRTGDLVRHRVDGVLEFVGRVDRQVKVRGHRIEPAEIERVLETVDGVRRAVVSVRPAAGGRLVAHVVPDAGGTNLPSALVDELRAAVLAALPAAALPTAWVAVDALPRDAHGKVDFAALPEPSDAAATAGGPPLGPVETLVAGVWCQVLGRSEVGREDDFFRLGGHSLLATRVAARLRDAFGVEVPVRALFERPTVAGLAGWVAEHRQGAGPATPPLVALPREPGRDLPASFGQERLWFLQRLDPASSVYNMPVALALEGALDVAALASALGGVRARHEVLRTRFVETADGLVQRIDPPSPPALPVVDLEPLGPATARSVAEAIARSEAERPFDLGVDPAVRPLLLRLGSDSHALLLTLHHATADGGSLDLLRRELLALYRQARDGEPADLPPLPVQYGDFAAWQRSWLTGDALRAEIDAWRRLLDGFPPVLDLPLDHPRPSGPGGRGDRVRRTLEADVRRRVEEVALAGTATPFMVLLAAYAAVLSRWCRQESVVVGTPVANRDRVETEGLIGFFANSLAVPVAVGAETPFQEVVARVRRVMLDVHDHRHTPFDRLVEELVVERHPGTPPLFQVLFVYVPASDATDLGGAPGAGDEAAAAAHPFGDDRGSARFDLTLVVTERGDGLACHVDFSRQLFEPGTVESLLDSFCRLVEAAVADPERPVARLPLLDGPRRRQLVAQPASQATRAVDGPLHGPILDWAARTPEAPAVVFDGGALTYGELGRQSALLAAELRSRGVGEGADGGPPVALLAPRSAGAIVALVAVLRAGAASLALDPDSPDERLAAIVADSGARLLLSAPELAERAAGLAAGGGLDVVSVVVDPDRSAPPRPSEPVSPSRAAYVVYTSGTTGGAKGVVVSHGAASTFVHRFADTIDLTADDRLVLFAPLSFDASVLQIFPVLSRGGALAVHPRPRELAGLAMLDFVDRHALTVLDLPAALWRQWVEEVAAAGRPVPAGLRLFLTGGESVPVDRLARWARWMTDGGRGDGRFLSSYGPTEATVTATAFRIAARDVADLEALEVVPLGEPLPHVVCHLLDPRLEPVPQGMLGEIHLGGPSLARGYVGRPAETAERFVPDPFGASGGRLYATGDLARRRPGGSLEFAGRADQQVKVRGVRIELGEVETALAAHPDVAEAAARVDDDPRGGSRLVAWAVSRGEGPAPTADALRRHLAERLPEVMVPARVVLLDALPVSASGKLDRRALAVPAGDPADDRGEGLETPLRAGVQEVLGEIWSRVLGVSAVGPEDDFFDLGGHSLLATQVVSRVREALGVELDLRRVFEASVLERLADEVEELQRASRGLVTPPVEPRPPGLEPLPLSHAQKRLYFLDRVHAGTASYNVPTLLALDGPLDLAALAGALGRVVARHEVLRTTYHPGGDPATGAPGEPFQRVEAPRPVPLPVVDLAGLPAGRRAPVARRLLEAAAGRGFDLERGPVLRCLVARLAPDSHQIAFVIHHVAADGWSMGVLVREIQASYTSRAAGRPSPLEPLPVQYADYALWERRLLAGEVARTLEDYWRRRLAGAPRATEIPGVRPRPARQSDRGAEHARAVDGALTARLRELGRERAATLFMVLAAGLQVLVHGRTGATDLVLGTDMANRTRGETEGLIGFFINQMPLRVDLADGPSFGALVERVRDEALEGYAHQELPFDRLVDLLDLPPDPSRSPLFQIKLVLQNVPAEGLELPELRLRALEPETTTSQLDFNLRVAERPDGLLLSAQYSTDLYDPPFVDRLLAELEGLLAAAADDPGRTVAELLDAVRQATAARRQERETELARSGLAKLRGRRRGAAARGVAAAPTAVPTTDRPETDDD